VLGVEEVPPVTLISFVARQLGISPAAFNTYSQRDQTRREQRAELMERLNYRTFRPGQFSLLPRVLTPIAQTVRKPDRLVEMLLGELHGRRLLIPTRRTLNYWFIRRKAEPNS
jgi:Domain of unknown function (DUF4158)